MAGLTDKEIKILRKIKKRVEETHWVKNHYYTRRNGKNMYCLMGFVNSHTKTKLSRSSEKYPGDPSSRTSILNAIRWAINKQADRFVYSQAIESWNDSPRRTKNQVIKALEKAEHYQEVVK